MRNGTRANRALALRTAAYERDKTTLLSEDLMKFLPVWKKEPDTEWLSEISDVILQQGLRDLGTAFTNFFASCTGKRNGPKVRYRGLKPVIPVNLFDTHETVSRTRTGKYGAQK